MLSLESEPAKPGPSLPPEDSFSAHLERYEPLEPDRRVPGAGVSGHRRRMAP